MRRCEINNQGLDDALSSGKVMVLVILYLERPTMSRQTKPCHKSFVCIENNLRSRVLAIKISFLKIITYYYLSVFHLVLSPFSEHWSWTSPRRSLIPYQRHGWGSCSCEDLFLFSEAPFSAIEIFHNTT